jgi:hypothetical protein
MRLSRLATSHTTPFRDDPRHPQGVAVLQDCRLNERCKSVLARLSLSLPTSVSHSVSLQLFSPPVRIRPRQGQYGIIEELDYGRQVH